MGMGFNMFSSRNPSDLQKEEEKAMEEHNAFSVGEHITDMELDQVFTKVSQLNDSAVVHFVDCLCRVSREELEGPMPRVFCLQKIVETSYFNMDKSRLVWRKIWEAESKHFVFAASHRNQKVNTIDKPALVTQNFFSNHFVSSTSGGHVRA
jgi:Sec7-like guanine-nucleotide exchange factor